MLLLCSEVAVATHVGRDFADRMPIRHNEAIELKVGKVRRGIELKYIPFAP
jgi:hypothetical protein